MQPHGPWTIVRTHSVFDNPFARVRLDEVIRPDGKGGEHVVVQIKPGICVLPIDDKGNVYLTREFHYAVGRYTIEAVSGGIDGAENPIDTAKRELSEELGLQANNWRHVVTLDPFTSVVESPTELFIATGLQKVEDNPEGTEIIEMVSMRLSSAVDKIFSGEITHGPTCVLLFAAWHGEHCQGLKCVESSR